MLFVLSRCNETPDCLDHESMLELLWVLDHFLMLDHWKILTIEYDIAGSLRDKLEKGVDFSYRDYQDALSLLNKVFDISCEIPTDQFRWCEDDYLQLALVLEGLIQQG